MEKKIHFLWRGIFGKGNIWRWKICVLPRRRSRRKKRRKTFGEGKYAVAEEKKTREYHEGTYAEEKTKHFFCTQPAVRRLLTFKRTVKLHIF